MPLGWIDFSKTERSKVLSVLDMLSEDATLDELGVAPIRDGYANLFFPGTSTLQTRAKYFFIIPYGLRDMECSEEIHPGRVQTAFSALERFCGEHFLADNAGEEGVIGRRSLAAGRWVKRSPADIYWAGLRKFGIFNGGTMSLGEYIRAMCALKEQKSTLKNLGSKNDAAEENETDDADAGDVRSYSFWNMPLYRKEWKDDLCIALSKEEGAFLKSQILLTCPDSMMSIILKNDMRDVLSCDSFQELQLYLDRFPEHIQQDFTSARAFSDFIYAIRTIYNVIISDGENLDATGELERLLPAFPELAEIDIDAIFARLEIYHNPALRAFLKTSQELMRNRDIDGLKKCIKNREIALKGQSRAKTCHPGQFENGWYGGGQLGYRFGNAKVILTDIFQSEVTDHAESEQ